MALASSIISSSASRSRLPLLQASSAAGSWTGSEIILLGTLSGTISGKSFGKEFGVGFLTGDKQRSGDWFFSRRDGFNGRESGSGGSTTGDFCFSAVVGVPLGRNRRCEVSRTERNWIHSDGYDSLTRATFVYSG